MELELNPLENGAYAFYLNLFTAGVTRGSRVTEQEKCIDKRMFWQEYKQQRMGNILTTRSYCHKRSAKCNQKQINICLPLDALSQGRQLLDRSEKKRTEKSKPYTSTDPLQCPLPVIFLWCKSPNLAQAASLFEVSVSYTQTRQASSEREISSLQRPLPVPSTTNTTDGIRKGDPSNKARADLRRRPQRSPGQALCHIMQVTNSSSNQSKDSAGLPLAVISQNSAFRHKSYF